ncbi:hypothetical protein Esti_002184 [Eimeria stiedai]
MKLSAVSAMALQVVLAMSPSSSAAQSERMPPDALQGILDSLCMEIFSRACQLNPHFCVDAVARHAGGREDEETAWRCYSSKEVDFTVVGEGCVDNCGAMKECEGAILGSSLEHLSKTDEINAELDALSEPMCKMSTRQG